MHSWHTYPSIQLTAPVYALATGSGYLWAGGEGGLAQYDGHEWQSQSAELPLSAVSALCFAGGWLIAAGPEGIMRSSDLGERWEVSERPGNPQPVAVLRAAPDFDKTPFLHAAVLGNGILRSQDAGHTWQISDFGLQNGNALALAWREDAQLLVGTEDGIYRSPVGGRAWRLTEGTDGKEVIDVIYLRGSVALAASASGELLISDDHGASWNTQPASGLPEGTTFSALANAHSNTLLLGTLEDGTFKSSDDGASWTHLSDDCAQVFLNAEDGVYAGLADGLARYVDGQWERLPAPPIHDLRMLLAAGDQVVVAGLRSGVWTWSAAGSWQNLAQVDDIITAAALIPDSTLLLAGPHGLFRSQDGEHWAQVYEAQEDEAPFMRFTFREDGWGWTGSADSSLLMRTQDYGETWERLASPFGVRSLVALQHTSTILIAATYAPDQQIVQLWNSMDGGQTWNSGAQVRTNWPVVNICDLPPVITIGDQAFVLQLNGQWQQRQVGPRGSGILRIASTGSTLLALTSTGLLRSEDFGEHWSAVDDAPPASQVADMVLVRDSSASQRLFFLLTSGQVMDCLVS